MEIMAVINQKGGVGKTTTAHNLGIGLQKRGKKVLLVDLDPQTNLTFTVLKQIPNKSIFEALTGKNDIKECIYQNDGVDVAPSSPMLSVIDNYLNGTGKEYKLKEILQDIMENYDYIIIDTPPSLSILTANALTVSHKAIITAQADIYSIQGIGQLVQNIEAVKKYCNNALNIEGILLTRYSNRAVLTKGMTENIENIAKNIGTKVFNTKIRECIAIKEAQARQSNIFDYAKKSNAAKDYNNFIDEILG